MAAAKTAEELLKALPASVNAENYAAAKSAIIAARATYDALSEDARALITSYAKLTAAESALAAYEKELSEKEAAQAVNAQIDALPAEITAENYDSAKTAIEAARTAYDALSRRAETAGYFLFQTDGGGKRPENVRGQPEFQRRLLEHRRVQRSGRFPRAGAGCGRHRVRTQKERLIFYKRSERHATALRAF